MGGVQRRRGRAAGKALVSEGKLYEENEDFPSLKTGNSRDTQENRRGK